MAGAMTAVLVAVLAVLAVGVADAALTYTGPESLTMKDTNPLHTLAECTASTGCVPYTGVFTVSDASYPYLYDLKVPSGVHLADGKLAAGSTGLITFLLPWGTYLLTFKVWGKGAPLVVTIPVTVIGFKDITSFLPISNCAASDAKYGIDITGGVRWAWYALQKNNSVYTKGVAQPWYTGSASHYHTHAYWHLALDPVNKGAMETVSFCRVTLPYFDDGTPDYTGTLLNIWPTRTSNNNIAVTVGNYPFYGPGDRSFCTVKPQPAPPPAAAPGPAPFAVAPGADPANPIAADFIWDCPETREGKYVVIMVNQTVDAALYGTGAPAEEYGTKVALHYVQCFGPVTPTYEGAMP